MRKSNVVRNAMSGIRPVVPGLAVVALLCAGCSDPTGPGARTAPGTAPAVCNAAHEAAAKKRIMSAPLPANLMDVSYQNETMAPTRLKAYGINGKAVFEGDIELASLDDRLSQKGTIIQGSGYRWPGGTVPYTIEMEKPERARQAMRLIEATGAVKFVPRTSEHDYVAFVPGSNPNVGSSPVGRQGGRQTVTVGSNCHYGVVMHEICHALGMWHEQSRIDRDKYVCVMWDNIDPDRRFNFNQHIRDGIDVQGYDYDSIMHYFATAFSKNGQPTLVAKQAGARFGQQDHLSRGDVATLRTLYPH